MINVGRLISLDYRKYCGDGILENTYSQQMINEFRVIRKTCNDK